MNQLLHNSTCLSLSGNMYIITVDTISAQSNHINKARLKVLQAREETLNDLVASTRKQLYGVAADEAKYTQLLKGLILQGLHQLLEAEVMIMCRAKDVKLVEEAVVMAKKEYLATVPKHIPALNVTIDKAQFLPDTSYDGLLCVACMLLDSALIIAYT